MKKIDNVVVPQWDSYDCQPGRFAIIAIKDPIRGCRNNYKEVEETKFFLDMQRYYPWSNGRYGNKDFCIGGKAYRPLLSEMDIYGKEITISIKFYRKPSSNDRQSLFLEILGTVRHELEHLVEPEDLFFKEKMPYFNYPKNSLRFRRGWIESPSELRATAAEISIITSKSKMSAKELIDNSANVGYYWLRHFGMDDRKSSKITDKWHKNLTKAVKNFNSKKL